MKVNRRRPKQVKFWVNDEEHRLIKEKVSESKLTQNEFFIRCALEKDIQVIEGLSEIIVELSNGHNILADLKDNKELDHKHIEEIKCRLNGLYKTIENILNEEGYYGNN